MQTRKCTHCIGSRSTPSLIPKLVLGCFINNSSSNNNKGDLLDAAHQAISELGSVIRRQSTEIANEVQVVVGESLII